MNRLKSRFAAALCLALAGCSTQDVGQQAASGLRRKIGYRCTVQYRRDALGGTGDIPASPTTNASANGADLSITGVLKDVKGDWLVLERRIGGTPGSPNSVVTDCWVPTHSVLLLEWSAQRVN